MEQQVTFPSQGVTLSGTLHRPDGGDGQLRPGLVLCHGFGGSSNGSGHPQLARALERAGHIVLRFDFRGCGASGGEPGRVICDEEVEDARHAVTFLRSQPGVDQNRISIMGASLGGAVAIVATATDERIRGCISSNSPAAHDRQLRLRYPDDEAWRSFLARLDEAKRYRERTSQSMMLHRFEIVDIPERLRSGLAPDARMEFPAETAISMLSFNPEEFVGRIAPRPLLLLHTSSDPMVPKTAAERLLARAGQPSELRIIEADDHFASGNPVLQQIAVDWLARSL